MSTSNAEEKELGLVGKVEFRIAMADSDTKLTAMLNTFLAPLLLKLGSNYSGVRTKVGPSLDLHHFYIFGDLVVRIVFNY